MVYSVTKLTELGVEILGMFSSADQAESYMEIHSGDGEDEYRYEIKSWVLDTATDAYFRNDLCPDMYRYDDEDDDYDD